MTRFLDGPAQGQSLMLKRAPIFLRVVEKDGQWDALDQPTDRPSAGEKIYAYRLAESATWCHVYKSGPGSGFYVMGDYRILPEQPSYRELAEITLWIAWCNQQTIPEGLHGAQTPHGR